MELTVQRRWLTPLSTIGEMQETAPRQNESASLFHCYTLEPPKCTSGVKPRAIPAGRYRLTWRWSEDHQANVPHVEDVPDFTAIEIHAGNFPRDTKGCTCVGKSHSPEVQDFIGQSVDARNELYAIVEDCHRRGEPMWINYRDPEEEKCSQPA